ncbi:18241_t:CDS:2 [Rhizophagus irregularis]|nr:18241_t:CDS:2 [Rhizophagus irregularis]
MSSIDNKPTDNFNRSLKSLIFSSRTSKFFQHRLTSYNNNNLKNVKINLPLKENENNNNNNNDKKISIITKDDVIYPIINDKEKIKDNIDDKKQIFNKISTKNLPLQEEIKTTKSLPSQEEVNILFLQELLQDFEKVLTITEDFKGFDKYATDWMKNYIQENMKKTKTEYIFEILL